MFGVFIRIRSSTVPFQVFTNGSSEGVLDIIGRKNKTDYIDMHDTSRLSL
jgi:hypothetical protein